MASDFNWLLSLPLVFILCCFEPLYVRVCLFWFVFVCLKMQFLKWNQAQHWGAHLYIGERCKSSLVLRKIVYALTKLMLSSLSLFIFVSFRRRWLRTRSDMWKYSAWQRGRERSRHDETDCLLRLLNHHVYRQFYMLAIKMHIISNTHTLFLSLFCSFPIETCTGGSQRRHKLKRKGKRRQQQQWRRLSWA